MNSNIRILYVDDEEQLRSLVELQLTEGGMHVDTAEDGDIALDLLAKTKYDVVLLDIRMPRMNGIDVLKQIKKRKLASRVIMLTGVDDISVALESVKNGANDYLTKPYDYDNLVKCIHRAIAR